MTIHIPVQNKSVEQPITVRGGVWDDDIFDLDWCNHDGAEKEMLTSYAGTDHEREDEHLVCDKCDARFVETDDGGEWVE